MRRRLLHAVAAPESRQDGAALNWRRKRGISQGAEVGVKGSINFTAWLSRAGGWQHDIHGLGSRWRSPYLC